MGSKTISLKDEAYERLKALKTGEKSFSDVVIELTDDRAGNFENIVGEGIDITVEDLIEERRRNTEDDEREEILR